MVKNSLINYIIQLGSVSVENQLKAVDILCENVDDICEDKKALKKLLSTFVKFLASDDAQLQLEGAFFITAYTKISNKKSIEEIFPDALQRLQNLLSSPDLGVLEQALMCLGNIAVGFPEKIVNHNVLENLIACLNSESNEVIFQAVHLMKNISFKCEENVQKIIKAGGIEPVKNILMASKNGKIIENALHAFINIRPIENPDALEIIQQLFNRNKKIKLIVAKEIRECDLKRKIEQLLTNKNEKIRELSSKIYEFVGYSNDKRESNKSSTTTTNNRKRQNKSAEINDTTPLRRSKRNKVSVDISQTDTEHSESSAFNDDRELYENNFDDLHFPINSTPVNFAASVSAIDERDLNNISRKPSPARESVAPPFVLNYPAELTAPKNDIPPVEKNFAPVKYYRPPESFIDECCKNLGIQFDSDFYIEFFKNIKIKSITSNSKPATSLVPNDTSGFSCFSIFLTGDERNTEKIEKQIRRKSVHEIPKNNFSRQKVDEIAFFPSLINEHIKTICQWFKCRILLYCNGEGWQRLGQWDSEDVNYVPIFVLEKKAFGDSFIYEIVLTLKDE